MSNPFFEAMGGARKYQPQQNGQTMNPMQRLQELKANPGKVLKQAGFNVPADITGDPQKIINHLLSSGQVTNPRLQMAQRMMGQFMPR